MSVTQKIISFFFFALVFTYAQADNGQTQADIEKIKSSLKVFLPSLKPDSIKPTPVDGLYEIVFGPRIIYISSDGNFLIQGSITDLEKRENLTEPRLAKAKAEAIEAVGEDNMLVYGDADSQYTITVFTDIDCGFCRKLHSEMDKYNDAGIRVRYMMFPRAGKDSDSYNKAVSAWCADDRKAALTKAKSGEPIDAKTCDNPVDQHMLLGRLLGVQGTPAIVLEDGEMIPGYVPADRLKAALDERKKAN